MKNHDMGSKEELIQQIQSYWNDHIHDLEIVDHPVGTKGFFEDLDNYRFEKLHYLPKVVDFKAYRNKNLLEIGCGVGTDLVRFALKGANVTGVDLSQTAIDLAIKNFKCNEVGGDLQVMNGESLPFNDDTFDVVYAHGVIQYTADAQKLIDEAYRVLKKGGEFIGMVYNRKGWLKVMSRFFKVELEHEDAPVLKFFTINEFKKMLSSFSSITITPERFPVRSRLHGGLKGFLYNTFFVGVYNLIPRSWVRRTGWHIMASGIK
jgi:SAM-dependent methyltransferase